MTAWRDADQAVRGALLVLHASAAEEAAQGAAALPGGARPILYDFSLLEAADPRLSPRDRSRPLVEVTCVVLDCETTGLEPDAGDRVVSLAAVRLREGRLRPDEHFDVLVNPGRPIPPASTRIHGLTDAMVAPAPPLSQALPGFLRFAEGAVLVGHDVWFDLHFLRRGTEELGLSPLARSHAVLDTRLLAEVVHGRIGHTLEQLAERLGVEVEGRHSALGDALITGRVLERLLPLLERRKIRTLDDALRAQARFLRAASP